MGLAPVAQLALDLLDLLRPEPSTYSQPTLDGRGNDDDGGPRSIDEPAGAQPDLEPRLGFGVAFPVQSKDNRRIGQFHVNHG